MMGKQASYRPTGWAGTSLITLPSETALQIKRGMDGCSCFEAQLASTLVVTFQMTLLSVNVGDEPKPTCWQKMTVRTASKAVLVRFRQHYVNNACFKRSSTHTYTQDTHTHARHLNTSSCAELCDGSSTWL